MGYLTMVPTLILGMCEVYESNQDSGVHIVYLAFGNYMITYYSNIFYVYIVISMFT